LLLDDLVTDREKLQANVAVPPTLHIDPVDIPAYIDTKGRAGRQYIAELERIARHNLNSALEARHAIAEHHQRLELEMASRAQAEWINAGLKRDVERLRDEDGQRAAHIRADAVRDARAKVSRELEEAALELNRLEGILSEHDGLVHEYSGRLREEQNASLALRDELNRSEITRRRLEESLVQATERVSQRVEDDYGRASQAEAVLETVTAERDRLAQKLDVLRDAESVIERLTADLGTTAREVLRLHDTIEAMNARVESAKTAAATAGEMRREADARREAAEHRMHEATFAADTAADRVTEPEAALEHERVRVSEAEQRHAATRTELRDATRACSAAQDAQTAAESELNVLQARVTELESAPPPAPEPARAPKPAPKSSPKPAAKRAAPKAQPAPEPEPQPEPEPEPVPVAEVEPTLEPAPIAPAPSSTAAFSPDGLRRSAMAELTSLAATNHGDNLTPRRH